MTHAELRARTQTNLAAHFGPHESELVAEYGQAEYDRLVNADLSPQRVRELGHFADGEPLPDHLR